MHFEPPSAAPTHVGIRSNRRPGWVSEWNLTSTHPAMKQHRTQASTTPSREETMRTTRLRRASAALAALGFGLATGIAILGPVGATASSHREAPLIAADPAVDNTDVYAFVSPDRPGYVTLMANFIPFEEPNGGPNYYPFAKDAIYKINIDNNGDAKPDVVYRWKFHDIDKRGGSTFLY